jgi:hypothetical protein
MDYFLAVCQALGIGLAVGGLAAATGTQDGNARALAFVAAIAGAAAAAFSMSTDDESIVGGIVVGAIGGWFAALVIAGVVAGAARRAQAGAAALSLMVIVAALALAGLSVVLPPVSLIALLGLGWLASARRRRGQRKYEGLRILR